MTETSAQVRQHAERYFGIELPQDSLDELEICEIAGGDWLFRQGDEGSALYLLVRGRLHVFRESPKSESPRLLGKEVWADECVGI
jgi:CRP-like cAMP-binding protein